MRAIIISLCLFSSSLFAGQLPDGPHVITTGFAEVKASPDMAIIEVSAEVIHSDGLQAKQELDKRVEQFIGLAAKQLGLGEQQIVAQTLYTHPEYQYPEQGKGKPVLVGYKASRNLTVSLTELDKLSQLLDLILSQELQQVNNIRFVMQDNTALAMQARQLAIESAKEKAAMLAKSFDATLGPIYQINYQQRNNVPVVRAKSAMLMESAPSGGYLHDELTVRDEIQVVFTLNVKNKK
ncbi:SIMPL domain-containing protein [Motilimonas cestriensis]|uniref:SIMPL domain-containing protein n=1 Tax=Motilimonas cestriensis TaxID=2742685 RepID=UPI003DA2FCB0